MHGGRANGTSAVFSFTFGSLVVAFLDISGRFRVKVEMIFLSLVVTRREKLKSTTDNRCRPKGYNF